MSTKLFTKGQRVKIKPEWRNKGEGDEVYIVVGGDEPGKPRVDIQPLVSTMAIIPVETVDSEMLILE